MPLLGAHLDPDEQEDAFVVSFPSVAPGRERVVVREEQRIDVGFPSLLEQLSTVAVPSE